MVRIAHVITGLETGGAEMMLYKLLEKTDGTSFAVRVMSLTGVGPVGQRIRALGVPVHALGMRRGVPGAAGMWRLAAWLRDESPQIVQTWMYHADLLGGLAARIARRGVAVAWNVQNSNLDQDSSARRTIWTARVCAGLSRWVPDRIVCCGEVVRRVHRELGYADGKIEVIPNGIDTSVFRPDPVARAEVRRELEVVDGEVLIGMAARFDPQKDHLTFVNAAGLLAADRPEVRFVLCGDGVDTQNATLMDWLRAAKVGDRCRLLGRRDDMPRVHTGLDVASLSSAYGEGCPNAVGEAMACGVPCVVTDVGDSRDLVGHAGRVVPARSPLALAQAWRELVDMAGSTRVELGASARRRIEAYYELGAVVRRYEALYENLLERRIRTR
jgi:glycosyltransferase involved in cell wall biosynthesis